MKSRDDIVQRRRYRASQMALPASVTIVLVVGMVASGLAHGKAVAFPDLIQLPADFGPEGIAGGNGATFYAGSIAADTAGQILVGNVRTGTFKQLVAPTGRFAAGMKFDSRTGYLFVAGGTSGRATIYDASSGDEVAFYQFLPPGVAGQRRRHHTQGGLLHRYDAAVSRARRTRAEWRA
jgi:hypothetical protein